MVHEWPGWMPPEQFLKEYWQKKPLVMRGVLPQVEDCLSPDELAGLSCLTGVEARLVWEQGAARPWQVEAGPFHEEKLRKLPQSGWSLLVQRVDRLVARVSDLTDHFKWIPNWRIEDIMVSYAGDGSGVGPHTDLYDVFLIQGRGQRDWQIGHEPLEDPKLLPDLDMKILADFSDFSTVRLLPGDLLYIPPKFAHNGLAVGESMTYSVGFRAPSYRDLIIEYAQAVAEQIADDELYTDPDLALQKEPGLLDQAVIKQIKSTMQEVMFAGDHFARWFAAEASKPKIPLGVKEPEPVDLAAKVHDFRHREAGRFLYIKTADSIYLYIEGEEWQFDLDLEDAIALLCRKVHWTKAEAEEFCQHSELAELWQELLDVGHIFSYEGES